MGIQPMLTAALPIWIILGALVSPMWFNALYVNLAVAFFWDIDVVLRYLRRSKDLRAFLVLPISFSRSISWLLGIAKGMIDFFVLKKF
jgi:hypothetical protein